MDSRVLKRHEEILRRLKAAGGEWMQVSALADELGVSGWTLRRDLDHLEGEDMVVRQHGVAALAQPQPIPSLASFEARLRENQAAKQAIGRTAARLLRSNQHVAIGAGTTTTHLARQLAEMAHRPLHIVTNGLNIAMELAGCVDLHVTCTGGEVRGDHYTLTGPVAERALRAHFYDVGVIGVGGVALSEGLTVNGQLDAVALQIIVEQSRRLIALADSSKLGQVHFVHLAPVERLDVLITDRGAPPALRAALAEQGVEVIVAS